MSALPKGWPAASFTAHHVDAGAAHPAVLGVPDAPTVPHYLVSSLDDDGALHHGTGGRTSSAFFLSEGFADLLREAAEAIPDDVRARIVDGDGIADGDCLLEAAEAMLTEVNPASELAQLLACFPAEWWRAGLVR